MHQFASAEDRIKYCTILLQRTESYIETAEALTEHMIMTSKAIIEAAQKELGYLDNKSN